MKNNRKPMDMTIKPKRTLLIFLLLEGLLSFFFKIGNRTKLKKIGFKSFKEPSFIIVNHASFHDMASVIPLMWPHMAAWPVSIEEFQGVEWVYRHIGCIPKRKFTNDITMVRNLAECTRKRNLSVVIFPEARYSIGGVDEHIPSDLGKMARLCKARVIMINLHGCYIKSPQWGKHPYRENRVEAFATQLFSKEEVLNTDPKIIQQTIQDHFHYDDYRWQFDNKIKTPCKERATGIHRILYKCPHCMTEGKMNSLGINLWCEECGTKYEMDEYSCLHNLNGETKFTFVSDWYKWEKEEAYKEVNEGRYHFEDDVRIEHLVNSKVCFETIGTIKFTQDDNGMHVFGCLDDGTNFDLLKDPLSTESVHIEYNYKGRGDAIDFNTLTDTWFLFPVHPCCLTKFNFTTEALYQKHQQKIKE